MKPIRRKSSFCSTSSEDSDYHENILDASRFTLRVEEGVDRLGFTPSGLPPASVYVMRMEADGWAEENGVRIDDELVAVDDVLVSALNRQALIHKLKDGPRPMNLTFVRKGEVIPAGKTLTIQHDDDDDDSSERCKKPEYRVTCFNLAPDTWKVSVPHYLVRCWVASSALHDLIKQEGGELYSVLVPAGVSALGLSTSKGSHVSVSSVAPDSWAFKQGIAVGDKLLRMGLDFTATLTLEDVQTSLMQVRPLQLFLLRESSSTAGPVPKRPSHVSFGVDTTHLETCTEGENKKTGDVALGKQEIVASSIASTNMRRRSSVRFHPELLAQQQQEEIEESSKRPSVEEPMVPDGVPYAIIVDEGVSRLGFVPNFMRDDAFDSLVVEVTRVESPCWAEEKGVLKGDYLLMLSDDPVAKMSKKEIVANLKAYRRPLHLTFLRPHDLVTKSGPLPLERVCLAASTLSKAYANCHRHSFGHRHSSSVDKQTQRFASQAVEVSGDSQISMGDVNVVIDALKDLSSKFAEEKRFVVEDKIEVWSQTHSCWCKGRVDHVLNRGRVDVEYLVPDGGLSAKELFCEDGQLRIFQPELGPWPLEKEGDSEQKPRLQLDVQRSRAELVAVRQKEATLSASLPNWRDNVQKMQNEPLQQQLAAMKDALEASSEHADLQEQVMRAEAKSAQAERAIHRAELCECNRLAILALEDFRTGLGSRRSSKTSGFSATTTSSDTEARTPLEPKHVAFGDGVANVALGAAFTGLTSMFGEEAGTGGDQLGEVGDWIGTSVMQLGSMLLQQEAVEVQGWLEQRGPSVEYGWTSRWCMLVGTEIRIYTSPACTEKRKSILLSSRDVVTQTDDDDAPGDAHLYRSSHPHSFVISVHIKSSDITDGNARNVRYHYFDAGNAQALEEWTSAIEECIDESDDDDDTQCTKFDVWEGREEMKKEFEQALASLGGEMVDPVQSESAKKEEDAKGDAKHKPSLKKIRTRSLASRKASTASAMSRRGTLVSPSVAQKSSSFTHENAPKGVSVFHIKSELVLMGLNSAGLCDNSSMHEVEEKVIRPKCSKIECPWDRKMGAAYVDTINDYDHAGPSKYYISYACSDSIGDVTGALLQHCKTKDADPKRTCVWMCCLCSNLHRIQDHIQSNGSTPAEEFENVLKDRILKIGHVFAICTPWEKPRYLKRAWCLLELSTALDLGPSMCKVSVLLPPEQDTRLCGILERGKSPDLEAAWEELGGIRVDSAECSLEQDRTRIFALVSKDGREEANESMGNVMHQWLVTHSEAHFTRLLARGLSGERAAHMCEALSWLHQSSQHLDRAAALLEEGLRIMTSCNGGASLVAARLLCSLGRVKDEKDDLNGAYDAYRNAKILYQRNSMLKTAEGASLLHDMGIVQASMDRCEDAITSYKEASAIWRDLGTLETGDGALVFNSLGVAHFQNGNSKAALESYVEARRIRDLTDTMGTTSGASLLHNIGVVREALEDNVGALESYRAAKQVHEKLGTVKSLDCADTLEAIQALEEQVKGV